MTRGFSLLEILLAIVLLTIGVIAISQAFNAGLFAATDVENTELALGIAQAKLESFYGATGGVADESRHDVDQDGFIGGIYEDKNFQLEVQTDDNNPEEVDVVVYWDAKGDEVSITLTTYITDY